MFAVYGLGLRSASVLGGPTMIGIAFLGGSVAAARYARSAALLTVSVTPPLLFFLALVADKALTATGNVALSVAEAIPITLAELAPWLFAGSLATLVVAWFRGLPRCAGDLRRELREERADREKTAEGAADRC